jgi:hypothetical protein
MTIVACVAVVVWGIMATLGLFAILFAGRRDE